MPLAFPSGLPQFEEREEYMSDGSPVPNYPNHIAIDPAILAEDLYGQEELLQIHPIPVPPNPEHDPFPRHHYQLPVGDPFPINPPPEPVLFVPPDHHAFDPQTHLKPSRKDRRIKRPRREEECSFCRGTDHRNKDGHEEYMLSCTKCGRSGHPTCMEISHILETVHSYEWTCIECKPCEVCKKKGGDSRLMFCDNCDRGWHYDCLDPPLDCAPEGIWHCPTCILTGVVPPVASSSKSDDPFTAPSEDRAISVSEDQVVPDVASPTPKSKGKGKARNIPQPTPARKRARINGPSTPLAKVSTSPRKDERLTFKLRLPAKKGKGKEAADDDESKKSPFESILSSEASDVSRTLIASDDKARFEKSRLASEIKLAPPRPPVILQTLDTPGPSSSISGVPSTPMPLRPLRSLAHLQTPLPQTPEPPSTPTQVNGFMTPSNSASGPPVLRIRAIRFGPYDIDTWYDAPFPEEYNNAPDGRLWMCEFCLKYMKSKFGAERHLTKCQVRHPPGDEIYRDGAISVFEVDGRKNKIYCQNLCLLSKMFLDHKSLFYDVEPFLFYVMTEADDAGMRFVGYFSKEKRSPKDFNVSCIMTLPVRQRKGWGNLLIDFSYLLSKKEVRIGGPERPLSALGALSYRNYWTLAIMQYLQAPPPHVTLESISAHTSMTINDILSTLKEQGMIDIEESLPPSSPRPSLLLKNRARGRNGTALARKSLSRKGSARDDTPSTPRVPTSYSIHWDKEVVDAYLAKWEGKGYLKLRPHRLKWSPYLLARTRKADTAAPPAVAAVDLPNHITNSPLDPATSLLFSPHPGMEHRNGVAGPSGTTNGDHIVDEPSVMDQENPEDIEAVTPMRKLRDRPPRETGQRQGRRLTRSKSQLEIGSIRGVSETSQSGLATHLNGTPDVAVSDIGQIDDIIESDGALAARLALDQERPRRQLRARNSASSFSNPPPFSSPVTPAPKKRRIIESSPESPIANLPTPLPAAPSPPPPATNGRRRTRSAALPPPAVSPPNTPRNGNSHIHIPSSPILRRNSARINGANNHIPDPSVPRTPTKKDLRSQGENASPEKPAPTPTPMPMPMPMPVPMPMQKEHVVPDENNLKVLALLDGSDIDAEGEIYTEEDAEGEDEDADGEFEYDIT